MRYKLLGYGILVLALAAIVGVTLNYQISHQALPSPVVHQDPTSNWKTYTNSEYGFEFKYPGDWDLKTGAQRGVWDKFNLVNIRKYLNNSDYYEVEFTSSVLDLKGNSKTIGQRELAGTIWTEVEDNDGVPGQDAPHDSLVLFTSKNGLNFEISIYPATDKPYDNKIVLNPLLNEIVSTFKFTNAVAGQFCGGIAAIRCPGGYSCGYVGNYPDAGGKCEKIN